MTLFICTALDTTSHSPHCAHHSHNWVYVGLQVLLAAFWVTVNKTQSTRLIEPVVSKLTGSAANRTPTEVPNKAWRALGPARGAGSDQLDALLRTSLIASCCTGLRWEYGFIDWTFLFPLICSISVAATLQSDSFWIRHFRAEWFVSLQSPAIPARTPMRFSRVCSHH